MSIRRLDIEGVLGVFTSVDAIPGAVKLAQESYWADLEVYLPIDDQASVEEAHHAPSPVRWFALAGGLFGVALGFGISMLASADYPLVTGGKPIQSLPPFAVVAFELMLLCAAFGAIVGFLWCSRLPHLAPSSAYRQDLAVDSPALLIRSVPTDDAQSMAEQVLREAGARQVIRVRTEERGKLEEVP